MVWLRAVSVDIRNLGDTFPSAKVTAFSAIETFEKGIGCVKRRFLV